MAAAIYGDSAAAARLSGAAKPSPEPMATRSAGWRGIVPLVSAAALSWVPGSRLRLAPESRALERPMRGRYSPSNASGSFFPPPPVSPGRRSRARNP